MYAIDPPRSAVAVEQRSLRRGDALQPPVQRLVRLARGAQEAAPGRLVRPPVHGQEATAPLDVPEETGPEVALRAPEKPGPVALRPVGGDEGAHVVRGDLVLPDAQVHARHSIMRLCAPRAGPC